MDTYLEDQYSCSRHSVKFNDPDLVISEFVRVSTNATEEAKANIPHEVDLKYGDTPRQSYDFYGTDLPQESAIVAFIHGGYWQALDKTSAAPMAQPLYNEHLKLAVADYDLAPQVKLETIVDQIGAFGRHILDVAANLGSTGVWFVGHSAGAHLASCLLRSSFQNKLTPDTKTLFKGLILISGVYDVTPIVRTTINEPLQLTIDDAKIASTFHDFDKRHDSKILIALGSEESAEFHRQSQDIHERGLKAGTASELLIIEKNDHFTIIENLNDSSFELTRKIISFVKN